jgi:hypothetical protein
MRAVSATHRDAERRGRIAAVAIVSFAPAAMELARQLSHGGALELSYLAFLTAATAFLAIALNAIFDLAMKRRMEGARSIALFFAAALALGGIEGSIGWALSAGFDLPIVEPAHRSLVIVVRMGAINGLLGLGLWAIAVLVPFTVRDANARAAESERLRVTAELAQLRASLHPHFIFNTLSTIAGLVGEDPREARRLIGALGDLLRDSLLENDEMQTLDAEVAWLKRYAAILETRHRGALTFRWEIEESTRGVHIPRLLLQPLLENAVKHGALCRRDAGEVSVHTSIDGGATGFLRCIIEDNGPGPTADTRPGARGIELVTRRLALRYGGAACFRLESGGGRTRSIVEIPTELLAEVRA